jgi:hypothetical protein
MQIKGSREGNGGRKGGGRGLETKVVKRGKVVLVLN